VLVKFGLKICIITIVTNKTQETQADLKILPLSLADCCLFFISLAVYFVLRSGCCLLFIFWGQDRPSMASSSPSNSEQYCCVLASLSPSTSWLLHPPDNLDLSIIYRNVSRRSGAICFIGLPSRAHLVLKRSPYPPSPHLHAAAGAVLSENIVSIRMMKNNATINLLP
jgi:hypothetical protein